MIRLPIDSISQAWISVIKYIREDRGLGKAYMTHYVEVITYSNQPLMVGTVVSFNSVGIWSHYIYLISLKPVELLGMAYIQGEHMFGISFIPSSKRSDKFRKVVTVTGGKELEVKWVEDKGKVQLVPVVLTNDLSTSYSG